MGQRWAAAGLGALSAAVRAWGILKEDATLSRSFPNNPVEIFSSVFTYSDC